MKKIVSAIMFASIISLFTVNAAELKAVGAISKVDIKGTSASVEIKETASGKNIAVTVNDELTVEKLKDKRISIGDEVRIKYESSNGVTKLLRKTAGC